VPLSDILGSHHIYFSLCEWLDFVTLRVTCASFESCAV
jgi:hypothetical protein